MTLKIYFTSQTLFKGKLRLRRISLTITKRTPVKLRKKKKKKKILNSNKKNDNTQSSKKKRARILLLNQTTIKFQMSISNHLKTKSKNRTKSQLYNSIRIKTEHRNPPRLSRSCKRLFKCSQTLFLGGNTTRSRD